jgi:hypothetical protein
MDHKSQFGHVNKKEIPTLLGIKLLSSSPQHFTDLDTLAHIFNNKLESIKF